MISVSITNMRKTEGKFAHTVYELTVRIESQSWFFLTRYRRLSKLHHQLQKSYPNIDLPFPPKKRINKNDEEFVKKRRQLLQNFLNQTLLEPEIVSSKLFRTFFKIDKHYRTSKKDMDLNNSDSYNEFDSDSGGDSNEKEETDEDSESNVKKKQNRKAKEKNVKHMSLQRGMSPLTNTNSIKTEESSENSEESYEQQLISKEFSEPYYYQNEDDEYFVKTKQLQQNPKLQKRRKDIKILLISSDSTQYAEERKWELVNDLIEKSYFEKDNIKVLNTALKVPQLEEIPEDCRVIVFYSSSKIHSEVAFGDLLISWLKKMNEKQILCGLILCYGTSNDYYGIKGDITGFLPTTQGKWYSGSKHSLGKINKSNENEEINLAAKIIMKNVEDINGDDSGRSNVKPNESCNVLATWDDGIPLVTLKNNVFENSKIKIIDLNYFPVAQSIRETDGIIILGNSIEYLSKGCDVIQDEN
ncbi:sorting nexin-29-related [Anaeramoeba flamelloides]|uniref:Sorting nexin-29-related n=1 Tax=Anaeramoeba flamelloides TaxID=1746091 RepID=A0AAV7ZCJ5_9EUKA|nr:sorting nexin-29-related [Anaeramoeba flamelloides]